MPSAKTSFSEKLWWNPHILRNNLTKQSLFEKRYPIQRLDNLFGSLRFNWVEKRFCKNTHEQVVKIYLVFQRMLGECLQNHWNILIFACASCRAAGLFSLVLKTHLLGNNASLWWHKILKWAMTAACSNKCFTVQLYQAVNHVSKIVLGQRFLSPNR